LNQTSGVLQDAIVSPSLRNFDMRALHAAMDQARDARGLTWAELTSEVNEVFEGTPSIPISAATIRDMLKKRSVTSAVVLQTLRWLRRTPESFLAGNAVAPRPDEILPEPGPGFILRFDTRAMHAELNAERIRRGMTWKQVARELPGFSEGMLTNLAAGPLIGFPRAMIIPQWLGRAAASFVRAHRR
jgi:hypothetical protein